MNRFVLMGLAVALFAGGVQAKTLTGTDVDGVDQNDLGKLLEITKFGYRSTFVYPLLKGDVEDVLEPSGLPADMEGAPRAEAVGDELRIVFQAGSKSARVMRLVNTQPTEHYTAPFVRENFVGQHILTQVRVVGEITFNLTRHYETEDEAKTVAKALTSDSRFAEVRLRELDSTEAKEKLAAIVKDAEGSIKSYSIGFGGSTSSTAGKKANDLLWLANFAFIRDEGTPLLDLADFVKNEFGQMYTDEKVAKMVVWGTEESLFGKVVSIEVTDEPYSGN